MSIRIVKTYPNVLQNSQNSNKTWILDKIWWFPLYFWAHRVSGKLETTRKRLKSSVPEVFLTNFLILQMPECQKLTQSSPFGKLSQFCIPQICRVEHNSESPKQVEIYFRTRKILPKYDFYLKFDVLLGIFGPVVCLIDLKPQKNAWKRQAGHRTQGTGHNPTGSLPDLSTLPSPLASCLLWMLCLARCPAA